MKGLSEEIEISIQNALEGLNLDVDILSVDDDKLSTLVKSRQESFIAIKELLVSWQNSPNSPSHEKLRKYIVELVDAGENSIDVLRSALKKKIDFTELDVERYGLAIKAKPLLLKAISEINAGNSELRNQIEADKFDLAERDFKRGFPEKFANQEFYPTKHYHKEWHDEATDAVMICPLGTKGEIIELDGLKIMLPKKPKNSEILYNRKAKEDQYWRREEMPAGLTPETEDVYTEYIMQEFKRRREGLWFFNNGTAVYVTPEHYMGMQWNQMADTGGYKDFRMAQAYMYYFAKACLVDTRSTGMFFTKGRRTGFTEMALDHLVQTSTSVKNFKVGMTSKTGDDAEVAFLKYSYVIQNLPFFFQPVVKGKIDDTKKMVFGKPSDNSKASKKNRDSNTNDYLNTMVDFRATSTLAYDSVKLNMYLGDECFAEGTKIMMSDFTFKEIQEIKVGDKVMVEGQKEMTVGKTMNGIDEMYRIKQPYGKDYVVNSNHRLYLERRNAKVRSGFDTITPVEYLESSYYKRRTYVRALSEGFELPEQELPLDPYFLGLWLGDGLSASAAVMVNPVDDAEISEYLYSYADKNNMTVGVETKAGEKGKCYHLSNKNGGYSTGYTGALNTVKKELLKLNLIKNKHIPEIYMKSSKKQRLALLSGLLDSDGHYNGRSYTIGMSREKLVRQIYELCKMTGIDVSEVAYKKTNFNTDSYKIAIGKNTDLCCLVKRKQAEKTTNYKSRRLKMDVEPIGEGKYYGITLIANNDDDRRLILEDFTLSMNCGKWERPNNYIDHWNNIKPTMVQGGRVVGKAFLGSTLNPLDKGGREFQTLDRGSNVLKRNSNGRTTTGLYAYFLPAHFNAEDYTDKYGMCHKTLGLGESFINNFGEKKHIGSLQYLEAEFKSARALGDKYYWNARRLDPITKADAFRDEAQSTIFDAEKINEQLDYNESYEINKTLVRGNFMWKDNEPDTKVIWVPTEKGRFLVGWIPPSGMDNRWETRRNPHGGTSKYPINDDIGCFGIDGYDIDSVQDSSLSMTENGSEHNKGSKGAMLGLTGTTMKDAPSNYFFLEYITRPQTAEIFFEDCLMACVFYGMPAMIESNKARMLLHFRNRGYRGFVLSRFDKPMNRLSQPEKDLGGVPSSGHDIITSHWTGIESYIDKYVGRYTQGQNTVAVREEGEIGSMPFARTLNDWLKFNVAKRTDFDASIASGFAIMGVNRKPYIQRETDAKPMEFKLHRYN